MRRATALLLATIVFLGVLVLASSPSWAQLTTGPRRVEVTGSVQSYPPDGGMRITLDGERVDTNITNTYVPVAGIGGAKVDVDPGPVTIAGTPTFQLTSQTLALLAGQRSCVRTPIDNPLLDGGSTVYVRRVTGQTGIDLIAHDFGSLVDYVSCWPGIVDAGPLANCLIGDGGVGYPMHNHSEVSWDITEATEVNCIACAHGSNIAQQRAVLGGGVVVCTPGF